MAALTPDPVYYGAIEQRSESPGPFGPIRTVRRMYQTESAEAMGTARRLHESQMECQQVMAHMRRVCEYAEQREAWWRKGIESMEMHVTERAQERDRLLEISQRNGPTETWRCRTLPSLRTENYSLNNALPKLILPVFDKLKASLKKRSPHTSKVQPERRMQANPCGRS